MKPHPFAELFPPLDDLALLQLADDIAKNGLQQPTWTLDGQILDGRNRWKACQIADVECRTIEYAGSDPLGFVISSNLHRRQLSPTQLAIIAVELEAHRAKEMEMQKSEKCRALATVRPRDAIGRLAEATLQVPQLSGAPGPVAAIATTEPHPFLVGAGPSNGGRFERTHKSARRKSEAARQAAQAIGTNHDYVSKAKRLVREAPDLVDLAKRGSLSLRDALILAQLSDERRAQLLSPLAAPEALRSALAELRAASPNRRTCSKGSVARSDETGLSRLRNCFAEVLDEHIKYSGGEFQSLSDCLKEMIRELEKVRGDFY